MVWPWAGHLTSLCLRILICIQFIHWVPTLCQAVLGWGIQQWTKDKILFSRSLWDNTRKALGPEDNHSLWCQPLLFSQTKGYLSDHYLSPSFILREIPLALFYLAPKCFLVGEKGQRRGQKWFIRLGASKRINSLPFLENYSCKAQ